MGRFIASLILPGAGQIIRWRFARGLAWFLGSTLLSLPIGYLAGPWILILALTRVASGIDAVLIAEGDSTRARVLPLVGLAAFALAWGAVQRAYIVEAFRLPSGSMIPTLLPGDHAFARKGDFTRRPPTRGDIVVFTHHERLGEATFAKRVIGLPGETIEVRDDRILVNGAAVPREPVAGECHYEDRDDLDAAWVRRPCRAFRETMGAHQLTAIQDDPHEPRSWPSVTVPAGRIFVMGDNRDNSHDSRYFGPVPLDEVKAVLTQVWWSTGENGVRWGRIGLGVE